jgi:hypothetical protein
VRVRLQSLPPGVQHAQEPNQRTEAFGVGSHFEQRRGTSFEQECEQRSLVLPDQRDKSVRHTKDDVKVSDWQ